MVHQKWMYIINQEINYLEKFFYHPTIVYIILCRDSHNTNSDEINSLPSSSSPNGQNLIIRSNPAGIIKQNLEFFQNDNEYKKGG